MLRGGETPRCCALSGCIVGLPSDGNWFACEEDSIHHVTFLILYLDEKNVSSLQLMRIDGTASSRDIQVEAYPIVKLTPYGRAMVLAPHTPWSRHCILGTRPWAYHRYIPHGIWLHRQPHQ